MQEEIGRVDIIRQIGDGSFGTVLLAYDQQLNEECVVKNVDLRRLNATQRAAAERELAILAQLHYPNIVEYRGFCIANERLSIVMEYCSDGDLSARIDDQRRRTAGEKEKVENRVDFEFFQEQQIWHWFTQICLALKYLHDRRILHRDLKSQNVFLTEENVVKLGDFGIAKMLDSTLDMARTCVGTPYYISPEICENKPYDTKTDIWGLGCLLYEMAALQHPFMATNMKSLLMKIVRASYPPPPKHYSGKMKGLIGRLLRLKPADRPSIEAILAKSSVKQHVERLLQCQNRLSELESLYPRSKNATTLPDESIKKQSEVESKHAEKDREKSHDKKKSTLSIPHQSHHASSKVRRKRTRNRLKNPKAAENAAEDMTNIKKQTADANEPTADVVAPSKETAKKVTWSRSPRKDKVVEAENEKVKKVSIEGEPIVTTVAELEATVEALPPDVDIRPDADSSIHLNDAEDSDLMNIIDQFFACEVAADRAYSDVTYTVGENETARSEDKNRETNDGSDVVLHASALPNGGKKLGCCRCGKVTMKKRCKRCKEVLLTSVQQIKSTELVTSESVDRDSLQLLGKVEEQLKKNSNVFSK